MVARPELQEFVPAGAVRLSRRQAEVAAQETAAIAEQLEQARQDGYAAGVQAGTEAAAKVHAEAQDQLRASLIEMLHDRRQTHAEAQAAVLAGAVPLIAKLIDRLAPRLAALGLADQVAGALDTALATRPDPAPIIRCAGEAEAAIRDALSDWDAAADTSAAPKHPAFRIEVDPRFTPLEAEVHWDDGFDAIDLAPIMTALDDGLARLRTATGPVPQPNAAHALDRVARTPEPAPTPNPTPDRTPGIAADDHPDPAGPADQEMRHAG